MKTTVPDRPGHDRRYLLDSTKIRQELGWRPHIDFDTGVRETIRWYVDNRAWWEPLRDRRPVTEDTWATTT
jgi:dTDP-glucose 4,6-dehydratase